MEVEYLNTVVPFIVAAFVLWVIYFHIKTFSFWSSRGINGPTPWPLVGTNVYYMFKQKFDQDQEWHSKYGKTFGVYEGYYPTLQTCDNELLKHVFVKEFSDFTDRNNQFIFGENMKRWLLWSKGEHWSNQRALITPSFTSSKIRNMFKPMKACLKRFLDEINRRITSKTEGERIVSKDEIMRLTLDVISATFFGIKLDTYRDKTSEFFKRAFAFADFDVKFFFIWIWIPSFVCRYFSIDLVRFKKYQYFVELSQSIIDKRRKERTEDSQETRNDVIQALLDAEIPDNYEAVHTKDDNDVAHFNDQINYKDLDRIHEEQTKRVKFRKFDDAEIKGQMTFFFLAGFETTATSLSFSIYELAHRPDIQEELFEEISTLNLAEDSENQYTQLIGLKKLDAFVSEALRLYPAVAQNNRMVTNPRGVMLPVEGRKIYLPHTTCIAVSPMVYQRDPDYWNEPEKFDMTRFSPENKNKIKSCTYMPFGLGPRHCVGMRLALLNLKLSLSTIILNYHVSPGPNTKEYPPKLATHAFFNQQLHTDFCLTPRVKTTTS